jgi:hypothetical protein
MPRTLFLHPGCASSAVSRFEAGAERGGNGELSFHYLLAGETSRLALPALAAPDRVDGLWRTTCFEAFLKDPDGEGYAEFNFSPSTEWAAYRFSSYRAGMTNLAIGAPTIEVRMRAGFYALTAFLPPSSLARPCALGLSAVIEETNGVKSYWALKHTPGKPDFHRAECFIGKLR